MEYTEDQLRFIKENRPDLGLKIVPSLDNVIVEFLKKYEVFVKPTTSGKRDVGGDVTAGVITGLLGADVGMDAYGVKGQQKQTEVQEWTQWKQWALNHKDFEVFRIEKIEKVKSSNLEVIKKLKDPKIQKELEPLMREYISPESRGVSDRTFLLGLAAGVILLTIAFNLPNWTKDDDSNSYSFEKIYLVQNLK